MNLTTEVWEYLQEYWLGVPRYKILNQASDLRAKIKMVTAELQFLETQEGSPSRDQAMLRNRKLRIRLERRLGKLVSYYLIGNQKWQAS